MNKNTLIKALVLLSSEWEPGWSITSLDEVPKYGDIRDSWHPVIDDVSKQAVYLTEEIFGKKPVYLPWGLKDKDKRLRSKVTVKMSDLTPAQEYVMVGGLDRKVKSRLNEEAPLVVLWEDGRLLLLDHTRTVAEMVKGKSAIQAYVVGLDRSGKPRRLTKEEMANIA